jgi:hypothetical protein
MRLFIARHERAKTLIGGISAGLDVDIDLQREARPAVPDCRIV